MEHGLDGLSLKVLLHLYEYGPDTPKLMCRRLLGERTQLDPALLERVLEAIAEKGLVKRMQSKTVPKNTATSSIKPWIKVRVKSSEVRRHGQYYELAREGEKLAKRVRDLLRSMAGGEGVQPHVLLSLSPLHTYILLHLRMTCTDYAKSIARTVKMPIEDVVLTLDRLEELGLIERVHGSALKRTEAKLKLSHEVRKHHTYYKLSRSGEMLVRSVKRHGLIEKWLALITGHSKAHQLLQFLSEAEHEHIVAIAQALSLQLEEAQRLIDKLIELGLVAETKPKVLKMKHRRAKPKKETRCLHRYYRLTRLAELLIRYSTRARED
ncbi:protein of unknown function DUF2250 [Pyrolobus fumarii 1A]|uniref:DUF2250 domain-containing protein n=1 Tax=Pyrolobus fumarii (strain DSM 11204 / 1A) TaxID=694429 RepID=G0EFH4_PYRF1|nr:DUF2250 domain-containing protein [Pyrolobus fumarii]AEM38998.1 protein of unknown function DUF2250 [Pyrolobus fumarii 1A]